MSDVPTANWTDETFSDKQKGKLVVLFHPVQVKHNYRSKLENRPVYVEKIFITKIVAGDNKLVIDRPIRETDMEEFPQEWARWERTKENRIPGTPIESWQSISDTQKAEFRALNIFTVEQFAQLPDAMADKIMGFNALREKAKAFAIAQQDSEFMDNVRKEMDAKLQARDSEVQELKRMLERLMALQGRPKPAYRPRPNRNRSKKPVVPVPEVQET